MGAKWKMGVRDDVARKAGGVALRGRSREAHVTFGTGNDGQ